MSQEFSVGDILHSVIIVGTNGFVWYAPKILHNKHFYFLSNAQVIRSWGTTKGLAQLITGPTRDTVLDSPSDVILSKDQMLFIIPCTQWK